MADSHPIAQNASGPAPITTPASLLRLPEVQRRTGLPRSTIYDRIKRGDFPAPIKLSERSSAWDSRSIDGWIEDRLRAPSRVA
jgi:prophage regulatory protein